MGDSTLIQKGNSPKTSPVFRILAEPPHLLITGPAAFNVPGTSRHLEDMPEAVRHAELNRILEIGTQGVETLATSTTLRMVRAELGTLGHDLREVLGDVLNKDRAESSKDRAEAEKASRLMLEEHRDRLARGLARYLDPESQASIQTTTKKVFDEASIALLKEVGKLVEDGDESALGRLADRLSKEIERAVATIVEQSAARHALVTKSSLAGRPYEDAVEEQLRLLARPLGDKIVRVGDTVGATRSKAGDIEIHIAPAAVRGNPGVKIVIEAKRRGEGAQAFSTRQLESSMTAALCNRSAMGALFVSETADSLPLGISFQEITPMAVALAYDQVGGDLGLAVGYRLVRSAVIAEILDIAGEEVDRDRYRRIVTDVKMAISKFDQVRSQHQAAINAVTKATTVVNELSDAALKGLRQLDDLMGA